MYYPYQKAYYADAVAYIKTKTDLIPEIGVVLGSSLGAIADEVENPVRIPYDDIPGFLHCTFRSAHAGELILGKLHGKNVAMLSGRFHYYEGYEFEQLTIPVRLLKLIGVQKLVLTNIAGAVNPDYRPGDIVVIKDHIKLMGASPLRGPHCDEEFGPKNFEVSQAYAPALRQLALECGQALGLHMQEGIYYYFSGPQFETAAEVCVIRQFGADVTGMSTVTEVLTAAQMGMPVLALSFVSNMAAGMAATIQPGQAGATAKEHAADFRKLISSIIKEM